jgi:hypothetical protein
MNEHDTPVDERELELQEAEGMRHRAALLFADTVRLDLLLDDDEEDDWEETPYVD